MKLSLHVLGGLLLAATVLQAQQTFKLFTNPEADNQRPLFRTMETNITIPPAEVPVISAKSGSEVQALTYTAMYGTDFYPSWEAGDNTVFLYDHATNATFLFRPRRVFNPSGQLTGGRIDAYITTDDGANWATMELYNKPDRFLTFPRVGLVNANNAQTDPSKLEYIVFCSSFEKRGAEWPLIGGFGLFFPASGAFDYEMVQPENAPADLGWALRGQLSVFRRLIPACTMRIFWTRRTKTEAANGVPMVHGATISRLMTLQPAPCLMPGEFRNSVYRHQQT